MTIDLLLLRKKGAVLGAAMLMSQWHVLNIVQCFGKDILKQIMQGHGEKNWPPALNYAGADFQQFELNRIDRRGGQLGARQALAQMPQGDNPRVVFDI